MRSLPLIRTEYWNLDTTPPTPRSGATALSESLTDVENYLLPQAQNHAANLYTWGVADGLSVSAVPAQSGLTITPGVALDAAGHLIALAAHGVAIVDPTVDPHEVRNIPTVPVGLDGLVLSTAGLSGEYFVTLTWREVFRAGFGGTAPILLHAPWARLLGVAGFPDIGDQVILARVSLAATGLVTALAAAGRRLVGLPASRLELRCPRTTLTPSLRVDHVPAVELRARPDGGLDLNLLPPGGPSRPALSVEGGTGHLTLVPQGGNVGIGTTTAPTQKLEVAGTVEATDFQANSAYFGALSVKTSLTVGLLEVMETVKATAFEGRLAYLTGLSVEGNADVAGNLTVRDHVGIGIDGVEVNTGVIASGTSAGVWGIGDVGILAEGGTLGILSFATNGEQAGEFYGNVFISGTLSGGGGRFKIDHPLDPANQYLSHSFVESPEMLNIYNGNITTDEHGEATVVLPEYFETLNRDFRYQLTPIGQIAQAAVTDEIRDNRFTIQTDKPGVTVSWQVTGVRQDPWANAHRIAVEEAKPESERSVYLHPEVHQQPATRSLLAAKYGEKIMTRRRT
jgi:hypothetical protein